MNQTKLGICAEPTIAGMGKLHAKHAERGEQYKWSSQSGVNSRSELFASAQPSEAVKARLTVEVTYLQVRSMNYTKRRSQYKCSSQNKDNSRSELDKALPMETVQVQQTKRG